MYLNDCLTCFQNSKGRLNRKERIELLLLFASNFNDWALKFKLLNANLLSVCSQWGVKNSAHNNHNAYRRSYAIGKYGDYTRRKNP